jgi:hypothetical protein
MPVKLYFKTIRRVLLKQRRKFKHAVLLPAAILTCAVALILFFPVLIPIALLLHARDRKRMYLAAEGFRCIECGAVSGKASIERADDEWKRSMDELRRQNPGYRFRLERTVRAICTTCDKQYRFCETTNRFIELKMPNQSGTDL